MKCFLAKSGCASWGTIDPEAAAVRRPAKAVDTRGLRCVRSRDCEGPFCWFATALLLLILCSLGATVRVAAAQDPDPASSGPTTASPTTASPTTASQPARLGEGDPAALSETEGFSTAATEPAATEPAAPEQAMPVATPPREPSRQVTRQDLIASLTIFLLAVFLGFEVITKVPPTLHTPLMSGSNAISGITLVGALIVAASTLDWFSPFLGFIAVTLATINAVGGFMVTHRMLSMFKGKQAKGKS